MTSLSPTLERSQEQITFWDDFDEIDALAKTLARKTTRQFNLRQVTFIEVLDDLVQEAWSILLEHRTDNSLTKGQIISRVLWRLGDYIRTQVFEWDKNYRSDRPNLIRWEVAKEYQFRDEQGRSTFEAAIEQSLLEQPPRNVCASLDEEISHIGQPDLTEDEVVQQFFQNWSGSDFLFHQVKRGEQINPHHPQLERAFYQLFCAEQLLRMPSHKLHLDVKRIRAYIMMRRVQGETNVNIGAEIGMTSKDVGMHVFASRKVIIRWLQIDQFEQKKALMQMYQRHSTIERASLPYTNRRDEYIHPHDMARLDRMADIMLRKVRHSLYCDRHEWGRLYDELKQVALLHLVTHCSNGKYAGYAYRAAYREVLSFVFFQVWQKDPRFNRERDKHLALDVELENIDEFDRGENSRRLPAPLIVISPEEQIISDERANQRDRYWQKVEQEICDILLAMLEIKSQRSRVSIPIQAKCFCLRLRFGYTKTEIGDCLNIPASTASSHLRNSRQQICKFLDLSQSEQAARLLYAYFDQESIEDIPECQLQTLSRSLHIRIDGTAWILTKRCQGKRREVYLHATFSRKSVGTGKRVTPKIYVGRPELMSHDLVRAAAIRLSAKHSINTALKYH